MERRASPGLVDLSRLVSHGEITFDCLFIVDLDA